MKKLLIVLMMLLVLCGCKPSEPEPTPVPPGCDIQEPCKDDAGRPEGWQVHDLWNDEMTVFSITSITDRFDDTCVIFYSFNDCPWCYDALPILQRVLKDSDIPLYYVDVERSEREEGNTGYDLAMEFFKDEIDERMYMPFCAFIKNGEIVGTHTGTVEDHNARETVISEDQIVELENIYQELLNKIQ